VEGAAGVAVAALSKTKDESWIQGKNVVLLMCGANISMAHLSDIMLPVESSNDLGASTPTPL
jgi:threonine dehydratase